MASWGRLVGKLRKRLIWQAGDLPFLASCGNALLASWGDPVFASWGCKLPQITKF